MIYSTQKATNPYFSLPERCIHHQILLTLVYLQHTEKKNLKHIFMQRKLSSKFMCDK